MIPGVDYAAYVTIADALPEGRVRITFDGENLFFTSTTSSRHGFTSHLLAQLVWIMTEELGIPLRSCGGMTCRTQLSQRGLEPDECFYLASEPARRANWDLDLETDPPPDLAVEVDLSRSSIGRLPIYAKLRVPEVWRYNGESVQIYALQPDQSYQLVPQSLALPLATSDQLTEWVRRAEQQDETAFAREVRQWVRTQVP